MSAASLARRRARSFATCSALSCRAFSFSFRASLSFFWVAANCSSALDYTDFNISVILCFGSRHHGRKFSSRSAAGTAHRLVRKVGDGTAHRAIYFIVRRIYRCRRKDCGSVRPPPSVRQAIVEGRVTDGERRPPPTGAGGGALRGYSMTDRFSAADLPCCPS